MKKLLVVLLALTVVGVFAFADDAAAAPKISVGGWGRMYVSPITSDGTNSTVTSGPSWANNGGRVSIDFSASTDNMGFEWNPGVSNNTMEAVCDQAKIWVKVNPLLKIQLGKIQGDVLRGKIGDAGNLMAVVSQDAVFTRFNPQTGLLLDLTPVDGLYLGAAIDAASSKASTGVSAESAYKAIQVGAGYTIKDVGLLRAQYRGTADATSTPYIEAAFNYTGLKGLNLDVGAKIATKSDFQDTVSAGFYFDQDALHLYGLASGSFVGSSTNKVNVAANGSVYYDVASPVSAGVEAAFSGLSATTDKADNKVVQIQPTLKLGYGNGYLKVGFDAQIQLDATNKFAYAVPVQLEYWF